jgi:hypothetical protein
MIVAGLVFASFSTVFPLETVCAKVPVFDHGEIVGEICPDAPHPGLTLVDLSDAWAPAVFSETPEQPQPYRHTFVDLANERLGQGRDRETARRDRYFELFGIFPSVSVVRVRLLDEARHACHAAVDATSLRQLRRTLAPWTVPRPSEQNAVAAALAAVEEHLACEGFGKAAPAHPTFDAALQERLGLYQRRHMLPSPGTLDPETRETLLTDSRELDFRTLLRVLRERVADASGLIEDGSAINAWEPILGRFIDSSEYRRPARQEPLEHGAPDLIARATEVAAVALGWTSPERAAQALRSGPMGRAAIRLPPLPSYHGTPASLRAEVDRGDVWTGYPLDEKGQPLPSPVKKRPTFTLYIQTSDGEIPLVRWPTTIGAWKAEKIDGEHEELRYKESPVGRRYWRDVVAAPAWFPPPTTPDRELVRRRANGSWKADDDGVGPGYRSAYGLVALLHHRAVVNPGGTTAFVDIEIRTHGSGNYRSILRGSSHGCHRLFNHMALRLGSFVLAHAEHQRRGLIDERYARTIHWKGKTLKLRAESRGYRYELEPPIPVDVLPGRTVRSKQQPPPAPRDRTSPPAPSAPAGPPTIPQT